MISPRGRDFAIWITVFTVPLLFSIGLRFYVVTKVVRRAFRADDFLVVLSVCSLLALEGTGYWAIANGLGAHINTLDWPEIVVNIKLSVSSFFTWTIGTCANKLAVLYLYTRLFFAYTPILRASWVLMVVTACYAPAFIAAFMTQCQPVAAFWDPVLSQTNCRDIRVQELASVSVNLALDLSIVILPMPALLKLSISTGKKIGLVATFGLGAFVIAILIWRLITTVNQPRDQDFVYNLYELGIQSFFELWFGIMAANMPALAPLLNTRWATRLSKYFSYLNKRQRSQESEPEGHVVAMNTFGSPDRSQKPPRGDFSLLSAGTDTNTGLGSTTTTRDYEVNVEERNDGEPDVEKGKNPCVGSFFSMATSRPVNDLTVRDGVLYIK